MSKKKHPEHVNHERWLVSYADFITLLFAFFVVLFASGQSDKKKTSQMAAAMQMAFSPVSAFESHSKTPPLQDGGGAAKTVVSPPMPSQAATATQAAMAAATAIPKLRKQMEEATKAAGIPPGSLSAHMTEEGLVVSLQEAGFFGSGSASVSERSMPVLARLAASLPHGPMRVEGHTDNVPIHTAQFATNWELSSARATAIARYLLDHGAVRPEQLAATGYAEFRPIADNATEDGRAKNRRVDIILLAGPAASR